MSFFHYIDGQQVDEPKEWKDFAQEVVRDFERRSIGVKYPGTSTFTRGAYRMLRDMFVSDDCGIVEYRCLEECGGLTLEVVRANIILADCKWNLTRCEVECSLVDDGVDARISNNRGIPISPTADLSKNGVSITPVTPVSLVVFDPATGNPLGTQRTMFDWLACMQHAVQYMTDGLVTLQSNWYTALPVDERWAVCTGYQFRTGDATQEGTALIYKFGELFIELAKKYNLWLFVRRDNAGNPVVYIEQEQDTFVDQVVKDFEWTDNLIQGIDREQLWARVDVGSENGTKNTGAVEALPFLTLLGFSLEELHFTTECNTDSVLDLVSKYTICTNTLERMIGGDTGEDRRNVLIQYAIGGPFLGQATPGLWLNPSSPSPLYNPAILNKDVLERYALPSSVGINTAPLLGNLLAVSTNNTASVLYTNTLPLNTVVQQAGPGLDFNVDTAPTGFDPDGVWDVGTQRYTAPQTGFYEFGIVLDWLGGGVQTRYRARIGAQVFSASNVLLSTQEQVGEFRTGSTSNYSDFFQFGLVMDATDYVTFTLIWEIEAFAVPNFAVLALRAGRRLFTQFLAQGGGVTGNALESRIITYEFDRITNATDWRAMISDPTLAVQVAPDQALKLGHIQRASRNIYKGTTSYTLICKRSQK